MRPLLFLFFIFVAAAENDNSAIKMSAMDLNYQVNAYECDNELQRLSEGKKKRVGEAYRICFRPDQNAIEAEVGIARVNSWEWEFDDQVLPAVIDGQAVGGINHLQCLNGGELCVLDSIFTTSFYDNPGSVKGNGTVSFTSGTGSVPLRCDLFQYSFEMTFKDEQGGDMGHEEVTELLKAVNEHNEAVTTERGSEEMSNEEL